MARIGKRRDNPEQEVADTLHRFYGVNFMVEALPFQIEAAGYAMPLDGDMVDTLVTNSLMYLPLRDRITPLRRARTREVLAMHLVQACITNKDEISAIGACDYLKQCPSIKAHAAANYYEEQVMSPVRDLPTLSEERNTQVTNDPFANGEA